MTDTMLQYGMFLLAFLVFMLPDWVAYRRRKRRLLLGKEPKHSIYNVDIHNNPVSFNCRHQYLKKICTETPTLINHPRGGGKTYYKQKLAQDSFYKVYYLDDDGVEHKVKPTKFAQGGIVGNKIPMPFETESCFGSAPTTTFKTCWGKLHVGKVEDLFDKLYPDHNELMNRCLGNWKSDWHKAWDDTMEHYNKEVLRNLNKENTMKQFTKSDLKPMMRVELRRGDRLILCNETQLVGQRSNTSQQVIYSLEFYGDDLKRPMNYNSDIVKIWDIPINTHDWLDPMVIGRLLWEEERKEEMPKLIIDHITFTPSIDGLNATDEQGDVFYINVDDITKLSLFYDTFPIALTGSSGTSIIVSLNVGCLRLDHHTIKQLINFYKHNEKG